MKKTVKILFVLAFLLAGCTSKKPAEFEVQQLADELIEKVKFEDSLNQANDKMIELLYDIDNAVNSVVYIGSGATSEELAVFEFADEAMAKEAFEKVQGRLDRQIRDYSDYMPEEVDRLNKAVVKHEGVYIIYCVTADKTAKKIIDQYM